MPKKVKKAKKSKQKTEQKIEKKLPVTEARGQRVDILKLAGYLYLYIPIAAFCWKWEKVWIGLPSIALIVYIIYSGLSTDSHAAAAHRKITWSAVVMEILPVFIFGLWCVLSGIGGYVKQPTDWSKHNLMLKVLISKNWPVRITGAESGVLSYYLGSYLVPGAAGKFFGFHAAEIAMLLWFVAGLTIACRIIFQELGTEYKSGGKRILYFLILCFAVIFFSTFITPLSSVYRIWKPDDIGNSVHWLSQSIAVQYTSNILLLRWVPPQFIPCAVAAALLYADRNRYSRWGGVHCPLNSL